jgi:hypothetical protein
MQNMLRKQPSPEGAQADVMASNKLTNDQNILGIAKNIDKS